VSVTVRTIWEELGVDEREGERVYISQAGSEKTKPGGIHQFRISVTSIGQVFQVHRGYVDIATL
jgi:hypothetical protein